MRSRLTVKVSIYVVLLSVFVAPVFSEDFVLVDLKPYANSKIMDTNWWTGQPGNTDLEELLEIAQDGHEFEGPDGDMIPFKVEDAVLTIFGTNSAQNPKQIDGIEIGMTAESIYFLHMTGWEAVGMPSYKFVMNYEGGQSEELLLESNVNSDNWDQVPAPLADQDNSAWVWEETAVTVARGGLIATRWENPSPGKRIETIDFISLETAAVPALFAITLSGASSAVDPEDKLTATWGNLKSPDNI
jgi:hypothetical protein